MQRRSNPEPGKTMQRDIYPPDTESMIEIVCALTRAGFTFEVTEYGHNGWRVRMTGGF
jgi:hypothetical protein